MKKLEEKRINTAISLTEHQKIVLTQIVNSTTPKVAGDMTNEDQYTVSARKTLETLGMVIYDQSKGEATITEKGRSAMIEGGLMDDTGALTDIGQKYATANSAAPKNSKEVDIAFEDIDFFKEIYILADNRTYRN